MTDAYQTFSKNIERTKNFIELYKDYKHQEAESRSRGIKSTDILRAGVVFLHSTFEEYLRAVILNRKKTMLTASEDEFKSALKDVSIAEDNSTNSSAKKYFLSDLWKIKDERVLDVLNSAIEDKVKYMTFNDYSQIVASLHSVNIKLGKDRIRSKQVDKYIKRRHKIVHEADNNVPNERGSYRATSISSDELSCWIDAAESLVRDIEDYRAFDGRG